MSDQNEFNQACELLDAERQSYLAMTPGSRGRYPGWGAQIAIGTYLRLLTENTLAFDREGKAFQQD